jgi:hypothetical protein
LAIAHGMMFACARLDHLGYMQARIQYSDPAEVEDEAYLNYIVKGPKDGKLATRQAYERGFVRGFRHVLPA